MDVRDQILAKRKSFLETQDERLARIDGGRAKVGRWGGETLRFIRQQTRAELAWIERLTKLSRCSKRSNSQRKESP